MPLSLPPLPTMIVGSLPQPDWLIDEHLPLLLRTAGEVSAEWALWQSRPHAQLAGPGTSAPV